MQTKNHAGVDRVLLIYFVAIVLFGLAALFSASTPVGYAKFGDAWFFVKRQIFFGLIPGIPIAYLLSRTNLVKIRKLSWAVYLLSLFFLVLVFIPRVGVSINNSQSWIQFFG